MAENENKISKSYSLAPKNIEWLREQAIELSTYTKRLSDSAFLDDLITRAKVEQEKRKECKHTGTG